MELRAKYKPVTAKKVGVFVPEPLMNYAKSHKVIASISTFDKEGNPYILPTNLIYPIGTESFLVALEKDSKTYKNMVWLKKAALYMFGGNEKIYSMQGRCGVDRAPSMVHPYIHIVQIDITEVEDITNPLIDVFQKPLYSYTSFEAEELHMGLIHEMKAISQSKTSRRKS